MIRWIAVFLPTFWAASVGALELSLPQGSRLVSDRGSVFDSYELPVAGFAEGSVRTRSFEGRVDRQSWRIESSAITTLQLLDPLRQQLSSAGFEVVFECDAPACGGFDFRFDIEVIPAPDMYVDIRDYRFLAAEKDRQAISLIISRSRTAGFLQIIQVSPVQDAALSVSAAGGLPEVEEAVPEVLSDRLRAAGHYVLSDLRFQTGTTDLGDATYSSLEMLAEFLQANPSAEIALVGHTDATGELETNIGLSKRRAASVRERMITVHGVAADRIQAEGMGYLAPRASNLTDEGRALNRRVEVILLSLE